MARIDLETGDSGLMVRASDRDRDRRRSPASFPGYRSPASGKGCTAIFTTGAPCSGPNSDVCLLNRSAIYATPFGGSFRDPPGKIPPFRAPGKREVTGSPQPLSERLRCAARRREKELSAAVSSRTRPRGRDRASASFGTLRSICACGVMSGPSTTARTPSVRVGSVTVESRDPSRASSRAPRRPPHR